MDFFPENWQDHRGKILGAILGIVIGIIILVFGFLKTAFIVLCAIIGYYIGKIIDGKESLRDILDKILPPGHR
jgi:uncharacterized membrane protein